MVRLKRIEDHVYFSKSAMQCYLKFASTDRSTLLKTTPGHPAEDRDKIGQGIKILNIARDRDIPAGLVHSRSVPNDIIRCVHSIQILWRGVIWEISVIHCLRL